MSCKAAYPYPNAIQEHDIIGRVNGAYESNFMKYLEFCGDSDLDNYWGYLDEEKALDHGVKIPPYMNNCICTHWIEKNCYIQSKKNPDLVLVVGSECIKKVMDREDYLKRCTICKERYKGPYKACKECRETVIEVDGEFNPEFIVKFGKYSGCPINELLEDRGYCKWMIKQPCDGSRQFKIVQKYIVDNMEFEESKNDEFIDTINPYSRVSFGKYKGKSTRELLDDKDYCGWMVSQTSGQSEHFNLIRDHIIKTLDFSVRFGKYKGQSIKILLEDEGYCDWIKKQENCKIDQMRFIKQCLLN